MGYAPILRLAETVRCNKKKKELKTISIGLNQKKKNEN